MAIFNVAVPCVPITPPAATGAVPEAGRSNKLVIAPIQLIPIGVAPIEMPATACAPITTPVWQFPEILIPDAVQAPLTDSPIALVPETWRAATEQAELTSTPSTGVAPEILMASVMLPAEIVMPVVMAVADSVIPVVNVPVPCMVKPEVTVPVDVALMSTPAPRVIPVGIVTLNAASAAAVVANRIPTT